MSEFYPSEIKRLSPQWPAPCDDSVECLLRFGSGNPAGSCQTEACTLEMDADPGITNDNT